MPVPCGVDYWLRNRYQMSLSRLLLLCMYGLYGASTDRTLEAVVISHRRMFNLVSKSVALIYPSSSSYEFLLHPGAEATLFCISYIDGFSIPDSESHVNVSGVVPQEAMSKKGSTNNIRAMFALRLAIPQKSLRTLPTPNS